MGKIFTLYGPRGVGKTSIMEDLSDNKYGIKPIALYATRDPRHNEFSIFGHAWHRSAYVTFRLYKLLERTIGCWCFPCSDDTKP